MEGRQPLVSCAGLLNQWPCGARGFDSLSFRACSGLGFVEVDIVYDAQNNGTCNSRYPWKRR